MTAKIFQNAFLIGFTVLLACILLFFFIMYSNYQAQAYDILEVEAEHISEGTQICGGKRLKLEAAALTAIPLQFWKRTITTHCC